MVEVLGSGLPSSALHQERIPAVTDDQVVSMDPEIRMGTVCLQPPAGLCVPVIAVRGREAT